MPLIGFSNGALYRVYKAREKFSAKAFDVYAQAGSELIEVCINDVPEIDFAAECVPLVVGYPRKSLHLPTSIRYRDDAATREILEKVSAVYSALGAELAVVHPDLIDDVSVFLPYPLAFAIENMDNRKSCFKSDDDMAAFLDANGQWGMVLDVNHAYSNDPSTDLAARMVDRFSSRIKQIHLSGYAQFHEPLYETQQREIFDECRRLDVPIVIESTFDDPADVRLEMEYVLKTLRQN
jgi:hypothetical protein